LVKYFIIQETARLTIGALILFTLPLFIINIIIIIKIAIAPFHFWILNTLQALQGWAFRWVITFQKLPGMLILVQILDTLSYLLLIGGRILCSIQIINAVKPKSVILLSTTVTSRWVILIKADVILNLLFLIAYFFSVAMLLNERAREQNINIECVFVLVLMSFPLTLMFMIKVRLLLLLLKLNTLLILLFLLSTLGATLAYIELLKLYVTTRKGYFKLLVNKTLMLIGPLLTLLIIF